MVFFNIFCLRNVLVTLDVAVKERRQTRSVSSKIRQLSYEIAFRKLGSAFKFGSLFFLLENACANKNKFHDKIYRLLDVHVQLTMVFSFNQPIILRKFIINDEK